MSGALERTPPPGENRLLLLYAFGAVRQALSLEQMVRFVLDNEFMSYFEVQLSAADLAESRLLVQGYEADGEQVFQLTQRGRDTLAHFEARIPASRRREVDEAAELWREKLRMERERMADYRRVGEARYELRLRARQKGQAFFELKLLVTSVEKAERICALWGEQGDGVAQLLTDILGEDWS